MAITGSQQPYIFDLPHVLSLPKEFEFRFRYRPRWVCDDVCEAVERGESFVGQALVILFHSRETKRLLPIRKCVIKSLERTGPLVFLRFKVGAFPSVHSDVVASSDKEATRREESHRLTRMGRELVDYDEGDLKDALPEGMYLCWAKRVCDDVRWSAVCDANSWAAVAGLVLNEPQLKGLPMFFLMGVQKASGSLFQPKALKHSIWSRSSIGGFELVEAMRYRLRLLEWCEEAMPRFRIAVDADPGCIVVEGMSNLVVGRYDILEFSLKAADRGYSELLLRVEPLAESKSTDDADDWPLVYEVRAPTQVRRNRVRTSLMILVTVIGIALFVFAQDIVESPVAQLLQLLGVSTVFMGYGDLVQRFLKFRSDFTRFKVTPEPPKTGG